MLGTGSGGGAFTKKGEESMNVKLYKQQKRTTFFPQRILGNIMNIMKYMKIL